MEEERRHGEGAVVAKLAESFGPTQSAAESLDDFHYAISNCPPLVDLLNADQRRPSRWRGRVRNKAFEGKQQAPPQQRMIAANS